MLKSWVSDIIPSGVLDPKIPTYLKNHVIWSQAESEGDCTFRNRIRNSQTRNFLEDYHAVIVPRFIRCSVFVCHQISVFFVNTIRTSCFLRGKQIAVQMNARPCVVIGNGKILDLGAFQMSSNQ